MKRRPFAWIRPGNDHQLAAEQYAGRESATDRAARLDRDRRWAAATTTDRKGWRWSDRQR